MRAIFALGLLLCAVAASVAQSNDKEGKLFFSTITVYVSTSKTTSTFVSTTTCTTSTAALSTCTNGRRRRGLFYQEGESRARRGLFFNDDEDKSSVFLPASADKKPAADPVDEVKPSKSAETVVPVEVQSGFSLPKQVDNTRFLLAFATSTSTVITVATSTSKITAVCSSTTGFATCS